MTNLKHKRCWCLALFSFVILLIFLGMRVPDLTTKHPPQQHPRAVTTVKARDSREISCCHSGIACVCQALVRTEPPPPIIRRENALPITPLHSIEISDGNSSRAPPVFLLS